MHCLLDSVTPLGLASLQKQGHFTEAWTGKKDRVSSTMASEENPNLCIYVLSINEQPEPISITPLTWAKLQQLQLRTWASKERLWSKAQSVEDLCSCAGLPITCSGSVCLSSLQGNCSAEPLLLPCTFPLCMGSIPSLPRSCCFGGASDGFRSQTPPSAGAAAASSASPQRPVKGRDCSTAGADSSSFVLISSLQTKGTRTKWPRVPGKGLQHPCPAFWLPLRTCSPHGVALLVLQCHPSAVSPLPHCTPAHPALGITSHPSCSSFLWPLTSLAAGFF